MFETKMPLLFFAAIFVVNKKFAMWPEISHIFSKIQKNSGHRGIIRLLISWTTFVQYSSTVSTFNERHGSLF
jgi:hypothetical protein